MKEELLLLLFNKRGVIGENRQNKFPSF